MAIKALRLGQRAVNLADCTKGPVLCRDVTSCADCGTCATWTAGIGDTIYCRLTSISNGEGKTCPCFDGVYLLHKNPVPGTYEWLTDGTDAPACGNGAVVNLEIRCVPRVEPLSPGRGLFISILKDCGGGFVGGGDFGILPVYCDPGAPFEFLDPFVFAFTGTTWIWPLSGVCGDTPCPDIPFGHDDGPWYLAEFSATPF